LMFRKTSQIQSQWFDYYNFWLSRPHALRLKPNQKIAQIQMFSGNWLFGPTKIFQEILFDEGFDFIYEDLEFTYRIYKAGYPLFVSSDLILNHMERDKNILEHARVWSTFAAYRKAKHRVLFVTKNWTISDKIKFYLFGFRWQPTWLAFKILFFAKRRDILPLIFSLIHGTQDGLVYKK
jgi:GT2 family glycosyltransferase